MKIAILICGCEIHNHPIGVEYCALHAAAEAMNDALKEIARDATELAVMKGIEIGERRAWQAIANKARKAIGEK